MTSVPVTADVTLHDEQQAEAIVADYCQRWGWGMFKNFSGTAEWGLAVRATATGLAIARHRSATIPTPEAGVVEAESAREMQVLLINYILDAYHTTRLSEVSAADHILSKSRVQRAFAALTSPAASDNGYVMAFYELAKLMDIGARAEAPMHVWRKEMLPRLAAAIPTDRPIAGDEIRHQLGEIITPGAWWGSEPPNRHQQLRVDRALSKADVILAALTSARADHGPSTAQGAGWVYWNPDSGEEYAISHPIESGECVEAEMIRQSTGQEDHLHAAYQAEWAKNSARADRGSGEMLADGATLRMILNTARAPVKTREDMKTALSLIASFAEKAIRALAQPPIASHSLTDEIIAWAWPDMNNPDGRIELRRQFDALTAQPPIGETRGENNDRFRFGSPPEPMVNPSETWCDEYADWYYQGKG